MSTSSNAWMSNPQYLAQVAHALGGALFIVSVTLFSFILHAGWTPTLIALVAGTLLAALKEFVYDTNTRWGEGILGVTQPWILYSTWLVERWDLGLRGWRIT